MHRKYESKVNAGPVLVDIMVYKQKVQIISL